MTSLGTAFIPRVSVCMISYNHARFVEHALRSVIEQATPFSYEVVFADDCSTDDTLAIARQVARHSPVPVRFLPRPRNLGPKENMLDLLASARGAYIAYLEADDCWIDPSRLAAQVALLDARPNLSGCFGRAHVFDASGKMLGDYFEYHQRPVPATEVDQKIAITSGTSAPACTLVFRREGILNAPAWFSRDASHQALGVLLTGHGPLMFVDQVWGHYHVHSGGIWSMASRESKYAANFRYAATLASDRELAMNYPQEIGQRLTLSTFALGRERLRAHMGVKSLLPMGQELMPAMTGPALRALALSLPGLARMAWERIGR